VTMARAFSLGTDPIRGLSLQKAVA